MGARRGALQARRPYVSRVFRYAEIMSFEILPGSVISREQGWLSAWVGEEHVMMSADTGTCVSLSETGGRIWELLEQPTSLEKLCADLADEFDVEPEVLRTQVLSFLEAMQQQHAVTIQ